MPEKKTKPSEPAPKEMLQVLAQRVSVVVPLGPNRAVEMHRLEKGLLAQTIQPKEVVVEQGNHHYKNRNRGWQKAKGEMIWFLDSDIVPDSDAFERALEVFMTTETDAVEGHIYGVIERVFKWGFMSGHIFYSKRMLDAVGGFDERFTDWRGDTDLGWSILDAGGLIVYQPLSRAFHPHGSNTRPNLETERLLYDKHPELYRTAREKHYLQCLIND